jgi:hypothetical protein
MVKTTIGLVSRAWGINLKFRYESLASGEFPSCKLLISVKAHLASLSTLLLLHVCVCISTELWIMKCV